MIRLGLMGLGGLALVIAGLGITPDLRGWSPSDPADPHAQIRSTPEGRRDFRPADCMPGSVDLHASPLGREAAGSATVSIMTCRSTSSAVVGMAVYAAALIAAVLIWRSMSGSPRRRNRLLETRE